MSLLVASMALAWIPSLSAETGEPFRVLPTPNGCAVVLSGTGSDYRLERLVDGGVTVILSGVKLPAQEHDLAGGCIAKYRVTVSEQASTLELRPSGFEFSALIAAEGGLKIAFEKVIDLGGSGAHTEKSYRIGVGDQVMITVYGQDELTKKTMVGMDGSIEYPLLGSLTLAGKTVREVQAEVTAALGKTYIVNPQVSVEVANYKSQAVYVTGPVKNPGKIPLEGGTTLKDALSSSGGYTSDAGYKITVARRSIGADGIAREPERLVYSRSDVEAGLANLDLKPDDVVTVSEKDYFYIQAEVKKPGKYEIQPGLTLLQAIAVAEGLTDWADKKEIVLIRKTGPRQTLNLKNIERQKNPDVPLVAGDIIIVPRRIL
jgi:polysaccharide export outer membrane protein